MPSLPTSWIWRSSLQRYFGDVNEEKQVVSGSSCGCGAGSTENPQRGRRPFHSTIGEQVCLVLFICTVPVTVAAPVLLWPLGWGSNGTGVQFSQFIVFQTLYMLVCAPVIELLLHVVLPGMKARTQLATGFAGVVVCVVFFLFSQRINDVELVRTLGPVVGSSSMGILYVMYWVRLYRKRYRALLTATDQHADASGAGVENEDNEDAEDSRQCALSQSACSLQDDGRDTSHKRSTRAADESVDSDLLIGSFRCRWVGLILCCLGIQVTVTFAYFFCQLFTAKFFSRAHTNKRPAEQVQFVVVFIGVMELLSFGGKRVGRVCDRWKVVALLDVSSFSEDGLGACPSDSRSHLLVDSNSYNSLSSTTSRRTGTLTISREALRSQPSVEVCVEIAMCCFYSIFYRSLFQAVEGWLPFLAISFGHIAVQACIYPLRLTPWYYRLSAAALEKTQRFLPFLKDSSSPAEWNVRMSIDFTIRCLSFLSSAVMYMLSVTFIRFGYNKDFYSFYSSTISSADFERLMLYQAISVGTELVAMAIMVLATRHLVVGESLLSPCTTLLRRCPKYKIFFVFAAAHVATDVFLARIIINLE